MRYITFVLERGRRSAVQCSSLLTKTELYIRLVPISKYVSATQRSPIRGAFIYLLSPQGHLSVNSHLRPAHLSSSKRRQIQGYPLVDERSEQFVARLEKRHRRNPLIPPRFTNASCWDCSIHICCSSPFPPPLSVLFLRVFNFLTI
jgi:hypothetical protein